MSVSLYFGLPGSGKTTIMVDKAIKAVKSGRYRNIYCNVRISVFGVTYIDNDCIGKYDLSDCLILIDEATLFADNREHKNFSRDKIEYFLLHRHYNADVVLFTQQWDGVDKKIRVITDRVYYVYKGILTGHWVSKYYRIPYGIIIPDPRNKSSGEKLGDIVQGYCKPPLLVRMFATWVYRPKLYRYFDSWQRNPLPSLPTKYIPYYEVIDGQIVKSTDQSKVAMRQLRKKAIKVKIDKSFILLRSFGTKVLSSFKHILVELRPKSKADQ